MNLYKMNLHVNLLKKKIMCFIQYCVVGLMLVLALVIGKSGLVCKTVPSVAVNEKALMEIKGAMFQPHKSLFQSYVQILAV